MAFLLRCLSYFRPDVPRILWSLALTFAATLVALLQPIVVKVLFDSVLAKQPSGGWQDRLVLSILPEGKPGQVIGLAAIGFAVTLAGAVLTMFQTMAAVASMRDRYRSSLRRSASLASWRNCVTANMLLTRASSSRALNGLTM